MTIDDFRALGRIEGAAMAQVAMDKCAGWPREAIEAAQAVRASILLERMRAMMEAGATVDQAEAFGAAADVRFYEALAEIVLTTEQAAAQPQEPSPPGNRAARRAAKAKGPKLH